MNVLGNDMVAMLAYCAGVIDSDGTIGVKRSTYAMRKRGDAGQAVFSERICVKQVEPHAVDLLVELFGGSRYVEKPSVRGGRNLYTWQVTDKKAATAIRGILPYLRIKRAQAENCLRLRDAKERSLQQRVSFGRGHVGGAPRSLALTAEMEAAYNIGRSLNRVGAT